MTTFLSSEYWSERYANGQTGWDLGSVSTPLKAYFDQLDDKSIHILLPGCGFGHEGIYLYQLGFHNIHFLDFSSLPIESLRSKLPDLPESHFHVADFFEHQGSYDLIVEQTLFCAIDPTLRRAYAEKMRNLLNEKGKLCGVLFNKEFEGGPPYGGTESEYIRLFSDFFKQVKVEACYNSITPRDGNEVFFQCTK